jgi:hypothetical protein
MGTHGSEQEDWLIRIIKQAAEAIRRLRGDLTESAAVIPAILAESNTAIERLLGAQAAMLSRLDAETAVRLVGSSRRAQLWADLVELEADASDIGGDAVPAATKRARAVALRAAAKRFGTRSSSSA